MKRRPIDLLVISDIHLGTYGCHAKNLVTYLKSVKPKKLILNGDIVDVWQFSKWYWPKSHMKVLKELVKMVAEGIPVYYITGNHDDVLRKFSDFSLSNFHLVDKLVLDMDGKKAWIFHGDVFDVSIRHTRWLAKLGGKGYELLIVLNRIVNGVLKMMGRPKYSFSKRIKNSVKKAVKFIGDFEKTAAQLAIQNGFDYVICGHIHQPQDRMIELPNGSVHYLNSGDWIENLTALEYYNNQWHLYRHTEEDELADDEEAGQIEMKDLHASILEMAVAR